MKKILIACVLFQISTRCTMAQNVNIPDPNFKAALLSNVLINTNVDSEIQTSEAAVYNGVLDVSNLSIADLSGIEAFPLLTALDCNTNQLTFLDVASNTQLLTLNCSDNLLLGIDISMLTLLQEFQCFGNQMTDIDVSANTDLRLLNCENNLLSVVDVSADTLLRYLLCNSNQIFNLDVSNNSHLEILRCIGNQLTSLDVSANPALIELVCTQNQLSTLDISNNPDLQTLDCGSNLLSNLSVISNPQLASLSFTSNSLNTIDLSSNSLLNVLDCSNNQISNLDITNNPQLYYLNCSANQLTSLNLSSNHSINQLICAVNQIITLDVSAIPTLEGLNCYSNQLTDLDLAGNSALFDIDCSMNFLNSLNIQNGNNINFLNFNASSNNLSCIQVDDTSYMNSNWSSAKDTSASYSINCSAACIVTIPDANFKFALVADLSINTNGNSEIECNEASSYSGAINVPLKGIFDLTGIEAFTNIISLNCDNNAITSLDLSSNTSLTTLSCASNQITSLDFMHNESIQSITCSYNPITSLDLSYTSFLEYLVCNNSQIANLNLTNCSSLLGLNCSTNQLQALNLSSSTALVELNCDENLLSSLIVSSNVNLTTLTCSYNSLTYLNCKNGNNLNFTSFNATNNPSLICIEVDDVAVMTAMWASGKDATATYDTLCACYVFIPDVNFKNALLANTVINSNGNGEIECSEAAAFAGSLNVSNSSISDLSGIGAFTSLTDLQCYNNQLSSLDLSANTALTDLNCNSNQLTTLSISNCSALKNLRCQNNQLASLDISSNTALELVYCFSNQLTSLYTSNCPNLNALDCRNNLLTGLSTSSNTQLGFLDCSVNSIPHLDLSTSTALTELLCFNNQLTYLNIQNGNNLNLLDFDATSNPALTCVQVDDTLFMINNWSSAIDALAGYSTFCNCNLPGAPGAISGTTTVTICLNQLGLSYSIAPVADATSYTWSITPNAITLTDLDSTLITLNFDSYATSGTISVSGVNACGVGPAASLAVTIIPIPVVEICRASIDSALQKTIIEWQKPVESYVSGYVIYREIPYQSGNYQQIDTVSDALFSSYLDTGSTPKLHPESYKIAVLDSCGNIGNVSSAFDHQTMKLWGSLQPGGVAKLFWTDYLGITDSTRYYLVLRDTSGIGPLTDTLVSVSPLIRSFTDIDSYLYPNARYVTEMVFNSNCTPGFRSAANKSSSRSNIANRTFLFDSTGVGISSNSSAIASFQLYPNPAHNKISVITNAQFSSAKIKLTDMLGRVLMEEKVATKQKISLDVEKLERGIYFITLETNLGKFTERILLD